uniref:uncharacterized protein LOC120345868 n=1 Tax=Styela clava TaxID=7725 RepID=UPI0019392AC2|nr:uncharacterized protein LOC120345868 [Styela clava]
MSGMHTLLVMSIAVVLYSEVKALTCYHCLSSCQASDLTTNHLINCSAGSDYCQSTFAATKNGIDITRGCVNNKADGECLDGLSVSRCTCTTDKCNTITKTVKYDGVKDDGGGASSLQSLSFYTSVLLFGLLGVLVANV